MWKTLLKKQFLELNAFVYQDKKTGKHRSKVGIIGYITLFALIFFMLGMAFFEMFATMAELLFPMDLGWMVFAIVSVLSILLGVFGSVFNTYAGLYNAKDNDLLLSMPIPPSMILLSRIVGVYAMGILYEALVYIPGVVAFILYGNPNIISIVISILMLFVIGFIILTLTCILGWVVANIALKVKNKSIVTVGISLVLFGIYYYFCMNYYNILMSMLAEIITVGTFVKSRIYLLYVLGNACVGNLFYFGLSVLLSCILLFATYYVLSKTFIKLVTRKRADAKVEYKETEVKTKSIDKALLDRELKHYLSSATYMLNCSLGTIMIPIAGIAIVVMKENVNMVIDLLELPNDILMVLCVSSICMLSSLNDLSAPSVSLEGKNIWIAQSLPVETKSILKAKIDLHRLLTIPPIVIYTVCMCYAFDMLEPIELIIMLIISVAYVNLSARIGLMINLLRPNLTWTNETVVVKQSLGVFLCTFGGWILSVVVAAIGYFISTYINSYIFLVGIIVLFYGVGYFIQKWIDTKGTRIFEQL